ncbi:DUF4114 domain-containing protein [Tenacibaculum sp.]|nr:DUF4114 domain-containing protein [Tenacibaculum sp.]
MKNILLIFIILYVSYSNAQDYQYLGSYTSNGTPNYLENPGDIVSVETQEMISNSLPESYPVPDYNPQYITAGYDTNIEIYSTTDVWVTFVSEGAGYRNVLGFYTYDLNNPLTTAPNKEDITIIFPNVSALGSGGGLQMGDKVNIGTFNAGTGIGWVLLANAWSASANKVGYGFWDLYSIIGFNPEADSSLRYHNVLLVDPNDERIILGFEDIRRDYSSCDNDFNDAIFYITAASYEAINTTNFADVSSASNVTSAYDGGLESNGDLASLIAKRNFKRKKEGGALRRRSAQQKFNKKYLGKNGNPLIQYLPETGMYGNESSKISSPKDLLGVTNAEEIFSVDYYQGSSRISAVLATKTIGKIYDHSKIICDRLNNSSLEDVRTVITRGHQIISSKIKRSGGEIEYTLSFSIKLNGEKKELFSFWNIDQYPKGDYHNFQVWGSSFSQVFTLANYIIDKHTEDGGLKSTKVENVIPNVFVKSGAYENGKINLSIVNKTKETTVQFNGSIAETEVSDRYDLNKTIHLSGEYYDQVTIETGVLFDIGFSLKTNISTQIDAIYLADGPWGVDYPNGYATVNKFEVDISDREYQDNTYEVDRNPIVSGEVKGNVNLFRHILSGDQHLEASDFESIEFDMINSQEIEVIIMQDEERDWNNRLRYIVPENLTEEKINIAFSDFVDGKGNSVEIKNIKTIVFSIIGNYESYTSYHINIKDVTFKKGVVPNISENFLSEGTKLFNYPNPFNRSTTINLPSKSEFVTIRVFDLLGKVVNIQKLKTDDSLKRVQYENINLKEGVYRYLVENDQREVYSGAFMIE